ncbi:MAG: hypothetical protein M1839_003656 [Geoglossum umbratile]|nr:MAG: hypothetical protein M1839_003656 [Geoglossum umbratile]
MQALRRLLSTNETVHRPAPHPTILLKEIASESRSVDGVLPQTRWRVAIHGPNNYANIIFLDDPYNADAEGRLQWLLEKFPKKEPFERSKAASISEALRGYSRALIRDLVLEEALGPLLTDGLQTQPIMKLVYMDIEAQAGSENSESLHKIHWEALQNKSAWAGGEMGRMGHVQLVVRRKLLDPDYRQPTPSHISPAGAFNLLLVVARDPSKKEGEDIPYRELSPDARPSLCFISRNHQKTSYESSEDVAALLVEHGVSAVVLNACESASGVKSVALQFLAQGIPSVIAMSYQIMRDAAGLFVEGFYHSLLVEKECFAVATYCGREAMLQHQLRDGKYHSLVPVDDFIVPVLYTQKEEPTAVARLVLGAKRGPLFENPGFIWKRLLGRETDILKLELELLTKKKIIYTTGKRGVGTLTFLRQSPSDVEEFLERSLNFSRKQARQHFYFTSAGGGKRLLLSKMVSTWTSRILRNPAFEPLKLFEMVKRFTSKARIYKEVVSYLRQKRHLIIIDGDWDWAPQPIVSLDLEDSIEFVRTQRKFLHEFLTEIEGGESFIIMTCRMNLQLPSEVFEVKGLSRENMRELITAQRPSSEVPSTEFIEWHNKVLGLLDGLPGALKCFTLPLEDPFELWQSMSCQLPLHLGEESYRITLEGTGLLLRDGIERAIDTTDLSIVLAPFWTRLPLDIDLFLFYLSLFNAIPEDFRLSAHKGREFCDSSTLEEQSSLSLENVKAQVASSRLAEEYKLLILRLRHQDLLTLDEEGGKDKYYRINPLFTIMCRLWVLGPNRSVPHTQGQNISMSFMFYYICRSNSWIRNDVAADDQSPFFLERDNLYSVLVTSLRLSDQAHLVRSLQRSEGQILTAADVWDVSQRHLVFPVLMTLNSPARSNQEAAIIAYLSLLLIEEFDRLQDEKVYAELEEVAGSLMLAFTASNWLCEFFFHQHSFPKFLVQVAKSNEYSKIGASLDADTHPWRVFLDYIAAELTVKATRLRSDDGEEIGIIGTRSFGNQCRGRRTAYEMYRSDPRFREPTAPSIAGHPLMLMLHLHNLQMKLRDTGGGANTDSPEVTTLLKEIQDCCKKIRDTADPACSANSEFKGWVTNEEAEAGLVDQSCAKSNWNGIERSAQHSMPKGLLDEASAAFAAREIPRAKKILLKALKDSQGAASPSAQLKCHQILMLVGQMTEQWDDSIAHLIEMEKLVDEVLATKSEAERETVKAHIAGAMAVCSTHLQRWDDATRYAYLSLETCRRYWTEKMSDQLLWGAYYENLVLLQYLHKHAGDDRTIMDAESNRLERLEIISQREDLTGRNIDTLREDEAALAALTFATMMTPQACLSACMDQYFSDIPTIKDSNGEEWNMFVRTPEKEWWRGDDGTMKQYQQYHKLFLEALECELAHASLPQT